MRIVLIHDRNMGMRGALALILALGAATDGLASQRIMLGGPYGTEAGCEYHRTLDWNDNPDYFEIEEFALQTPEATCRFARFEKHTPEEIAGPVICIKAPQNDVPTRQYVSHARIRLHGEVYRVEFSDGTAWGPIKKC